MTESPRGPDVRGMAAVFAAALVLYGVSVAPVVFWGDSAEFARRAATVDLSPVARGYPLHRVLTWGAGVVAGSPALGANAVSALFGAVSAALAHETGRRLSGSRVGGFAAAATLALSPTFWLYSGVAEVYTLHTAILLALLLTALDCGGSRAARVGFGVLLGVSFLHHRLTAFALPGLAALAFASMRRGGVVRAGAADVLRGLVPALLPFAALCALASREPPPGTTDPFAWWFRDVFLGGSDNAAHLLGSGVRGLGANLAYVGRWIAYGLPGPALVLAAWGTARVLRRGWSEGLGFALLLVLHLVFPLRYDWTGDQFSFLLPFLAVAAVLVAPGVAAIEERRPALARIAAGAVVAVPVAVALVLAFTPVGRLVLPRVTDDARGALVLPVHAGDSTSRDFAARNLERLPRGALLHADWGDGQVYLYLQRVERMREDVEVRIWYGGGPRLERAGRPEWVSAMPGTVGGPQAVRRRADALEDAGGGLFRVVPSDGGGR